ncbi:MAG: hypothetical protein ACI8UO_005773 [Verrucomicrobiales bacterium]|jgi:hypothetical protein
MKTYSISEAKQSLGAVADEALIEPVVLVRGSKLLIMQEYDPPVPIPVRPQGYFDECHSEEDVAWENFITADATTDLVQ